MCNFLLKKSEDIAWRRKSKASLLSETRLSESTINDILEFIPEYKKPPTELTKWHREFNGLLKCLLTDLHYAHRDVENNSTINFLQSELWQYKPYQWITLCVVFFIVFLYCIWIIPGACFTFISDISLGVVEATSAIYNSRQTIYRVEGCIFLLVDIN